VIRTATARALVAGVCAGVLALASLVVVELVDGTFGNRLLTGTGLAMVAVSAVAGLMTLLLVWGRRFGRARVSAGVAVVAIVAGWALAQQPRFLPGLTINQAAAGRSTLVSLIVGVGIGAIVLVPSLLLFTLHLRGRFDEGARMPEGVPAPRGRARAVRGKRRRPGPGFAVAGVIVGAALLVFADPGWAQAIGVVCLCAFAVWIFVYAATAPVRSE
jgi:cytochrome bd ubiquinol oxidase subunit II